MSWIGQPLPRVEDERLLKGEIVLSGSGESLLADDRVRQAYLGI